MTANTNTTTHLRAAVRQLDRPWVPFASALLLFAVAAILAAFNRPSSPTVSTVPTPALPIILIATAPPTPAAQVNQAQPNVTMRALVVFFEPDSSSEAHAVEAGRHYGFLARSGADWVQLDMDGSGAVWVKASDLIGMPELADIATRTPAPAPVVAREVPAAAAYQIDAAPTPAPATPTPNWYTDIATPDPAFLHAVIGSDPNALACGGSPLCGGLTNAQAAATAAARQQR